MLIPSVLQSVFWKTIWLYFK